MFRKYVLPAIAAVGVLFAIFMVRSGARPTPAAPAVAEPPRPPFASYVAGSGLVEASTENIAVGTPVAGIVVEVYRAVGDPVHAGLPHALVKRLAPLVTTGHEAEATGAATAVPHATQPVLAQAPPERVNVNTASPDALAALPGVGPDLAKRIAAGRPYHSADDLEGTPLFKLDDRAMRAELAVRRSAAGQARAKLDKLLQGTRDEELRAAEAQLNESLAALADAKLMYDRWAKVPDRSAIAPDEFEQRRLAWKVNEARVARAQADYERLRAGTWEPDIEVAKSELAAAEAQVRATETELDRLTVRANSDGRVLQVKVRPGEFAPVGVLETPLMLLGQTDVLHIRTDVDENEALRVRETARAVASVRGDSTKRVELRCVRIEPYIVPKRSLTGDSSERVDTRVLQVLYAFDPAALQAYVGQQMDVFIEADPVRPATTAPAE